MRTSIRLYTRVALVAVTLMITAVAVQAQSGRSRVSGVVGDESATRQGKFVVVTGAKVELQHAKSREIKFSVSTDDKGAYSFRIPYGEYYLSVLAPGYRTYGLRFFVDSDASEFIAVLLSKE